MFMKFVGFFFFLMLIVHCPMRQDGDSHKIDFSLQSLKIYLFSKILEISLQSFLGSGAIT